MLNSGNWIPRLLFLLCLLASASTHAQPTPGAAGALTQQPPPSIEKQLRDTISLWGGAWAAQIPEAYFDFYSDSYKAPEFDSREAWLADRRRRIEDPEYIRIRLLDFELMEATEILAGQMLAIARFTLIYERPGYSDRTYKELELLHRGGEWKITVERNLEVQVGSP